MGKYADFMKVVLPLLVEEDKRYPDTSKFTRTRLFEIKNIVERKISEENKTSEQIVKEKSEIERLRVQSSALVDILVRNKADFEKQKELFNHIQKIREMFAVPQAKFADSLKEQNILFFSIQSIKDLQNIFKEIISDFIADLNKDPTWQKGLPPKEAGSYIRDILVAYLHRIISGWFDEVDKKKERGYDAKVYLWLFGEVNSRWFKPIIINHEVTKIEIECETPQHIYEDIVKNTNKENVFINMMLLSAWDRWSLFSQLFLLSVELNSIIEKLDKEKHKSVIADVTKLLKQVDDFNASLTSSSVIEKKAAEGEKLLQEIGKKLMTSLESLKKLNDGKKSHSFHRYFSFGKSSEVGSSKQQQLAFLAAQSHTGLTNSQVDKKKTADIKKMFGAIEKTKSDSVVPSISNMTLDPNNPQHRMARSKTLAFIGKASKSAPDMSNLPTISKKLEDIFSSKEEVKNDEPPSPSIPTINIIPSSDKISDSSIQKPLTAEALMQKVLDDTSKLMKDIADYRSSAKSKTFSKK